jgi:transcriptional regulator with XRE-family HTH domain
MHVRDRVYPMPKKPTKNPDRALALIAIVEPRLDEIGLSAAAFGRKAGIGVDAVSNLKKGTIPGAAKLVKMADALDIPLSRILAAAVPYAAIARGNSATTRRLTDGNVTHLTPRIDTTTRLKLAFPDRFIRCIAKRYFPR